MPNDRSAPGLRALLAPATTRRGFLRLAGTTAAFSALAQLRVPPATSAGPATGAVVGERFFDAAETEILTQLMERMTDTGLAEAPRVRDTHAVATVDAVCRGLDPAVSGVLPLALRLFEWGPLLFDLRLARFTQLPDLEKDASLRSWMTSRLALRRTAFLGVRNLCFMGWYSQPEVWGLIGYQGPLLPPRRDRAGQRMIEKLLERGGDLSTRADVCVIGSGAGGAVAAAELAAAGRDVVVLEQGEHWTSRDFTQREDEMLPRLFEEAGMRQTVDGNITILQGRCVGGSTVHNLCYAFRTPPAILRMWREEHALPELTDESLLASFERVETNLHVKPIREDEVNSLNRLLRSGARRLGYSGFVTQHNREKCVKAGYCLLGCSYDAKQSMLVTYVPRASDAGARVYANARAARIEALPSGARRVLGHVVDHAGRTRGSIEVEARVVVLAAGAVASPDLLLRSGLGGPEVGRHLHLHPSVMVAGYWPEPIHAYRGIPQSYYIDEFIDLEREPHTGYVLMPIAGFPVLVAVNVPGFGRDHFRQMRDFAKLGGLLVLLHDRSEGSVRSGRSLGKPEIRYALDAGDRALLSQGLRHCAEVLFAAGAQRVAVPFQPEPLVLERGADLGAIARFEVREGTLPIASTHPQSTCRMGGDPATSVVNAFGELHGVRGVFVADMSVFPTSLGAPPQITTAALADRTAHHILARGSELSG